MLAPLTGADNVTVPVDVFVASTVVGLTVKDASVDPVTVRSAVWLPLGIDAVITAVTVPARELV
jgi:hypothetical protein